VPRRRLEPHEAPGEPRQVQPGQETTDKIVSALTPSRCPSWPVSTPSSRTRPRWSGTRWGCSVGCVALLALVNLRGIKESGRSFAVPTYAFIAGIYLMFAHAAWRLASGEQLRAVSTGFGVQPVSHAAGILVDVLVLRAFASGCTALTGVERGRLRAGMALRVPPGRHGRDPRTRRQHRVVAMPALYLTMNQIRRYYDRIREETTPSSPANLTVPAANHVVVLVSRLHEPSMRALAYAKSICPPAGSNRRPEPAREHRR
jgi:hypothetical protein